MRLTPTALAAGLLFALPILPAAAETLTVSGIAIKGGALYSLDVPTIEVEDGNIDEATIRELFSPNAKAAAASLVTLDAKAIRIPELTLTALVPTGGPVTTYHDIAITDVVDGIAGSAVVGSTEVKGANNVDVSLGTTSVSNIDIGALLSFYGIGTAPAPTQLVTIYTDIKFAGGKIKAGPVSCDIGPAEVAEFKARPPKLSQQGLMELGMQLQKEEKEFGKPTPKTISAAISAYIDYITAFEMSPVSFGGLTCDGLDEKGSPLHIAAGELALGGWAKGVIPPISLSDFAVDVEGQGYVRFANATLKSIDLSNTIAALAAADGNIDEAWFEDNWQKVIPALEGVAVTGLDLDVPDDQRPGQRTKISLGSFDLTLGGYQDGIPTKSTMSLAGLKVAVPDDAAPLKEAGIDQVTLGFGLDFSWDPETKVATLSNLNLAADQLGSVTLSAVLGNVSRDVFSPDRRASMMAARQIRIKELHISVDNQGMMPILIAQGAKDAGQSDEAFRTGLTAITAGTTMALLGASPQTLGTVQAVNEFIAGRPSLELTLTAADPNGIGVSDFELAQKDPRLLAGKILVAATASGEIPPPPVEAAPAPEPPPAAEPPPAPEQTPTQTDKQSGKTSSGN